MRWCPTHEVSLSFTLFPSSWSCSPFSLDCPLPPCAAPLPRFWSWGENTVCTSGGDPDRKGVACGKGYEVKDALHSVCIYLCVHVCLGGVMWSQLSNAPDYKQLAGCGLNQSDKLLAVTSGGKRKTDRTFWEGFFFFLASWIESRISNIRLTC